MRIKFLLDEHLSPDVVAAVKRQQPDVDILRVGMAGAPPLGSKDPEILIFCEADQRVLVTDNRESMLDMSEFTSPPAATTGASSRFRRAWASEKWPSSS